MSSNSKPQNMQEEVALRIKGLKKNFGERQVLRGLDIKLLKGRCLGLLGPNGAGKTTTIRIILGLVIPTSGEIEVFGQKYPKALRKVKYKIGVVPQMDNLDPDLTIVENLVVYANYFRIPAKVARKRADELLEFFALKKRRDEIIQNLSGGQRRRLLLARALINNPDLLILDEPTIGLDPQARILMWQRLETLRKKGTTMLLTSHYMEEVAKLATQVIIIDHGKAIARGGPREMVEKMLGREVMEFSADEKLLEELELSLKNCNVETERVGEKLYVYVKNGCPELEKAASTMPHVVKRPATLEDLFLKLTGRKLREN